MEAYIAAIEAADTLKPLSKRQYIAKLRNLVDKVGHSATWCLTHPVATMASLQRQGVSLRTRKAYVDAIMAVFKYADLDASMLEYYEKWYMQFAVLRSEVDDIYADNKPNARQQEAYVPWDEVLAMRDALPMGSDEHLLLAMYTMIPPARADYGQLRVFEGTRPTAEEEGRWPNHLVITTRGKVTLTLGEYKTSDAYGVLTRVLPGELADVIKQSLRMRPRDFLFTAPRSGGEFVDGQAFSQWVSKVFARTFDRPTSINSLRHAFINSLDLNRLTVRELNGVAKGLMHSVDTLRRYRFVREDGADDE